MQIPTRDRVHDWVITTYNDEQALALYCTVNSILSFGSILIPYLVMDYFLDLRRTLWNWGVKSKALLFAALAWFGQAYIFGYNIESYLERDKVRRMHMIFEEHERKAYEKESRKREDENSFWTAQQLKEFDIVKRWAEQRKTEEDMIATGTIPPWLTEQQKDIVLDGRSYKSMLIIGTLLGIFLAYLLWYLGIYLLRWLEDRDGRQYARDNSVLLEQSMLFEQSMAEYKHRAIEEEEEEEGFYGDPNHPNTDSQTLYQTDVYYDTPHYNNSDYIEGSVINATLSFRNSSNLNRSKTGGESTFPQRRQYGSFRGRGKQYLLGKQHGLRNTTTTMSTTMAHAILDDDGEIQQLDLDVRHNQPLFTYNVEQLGDKMRQVVSNIPKKDWRKEREERRIKNLEAEEEEMKRNLEEQICEEVLKGQAESPASTSLVMLSSIDTEYEKLSEAEKESYIPPELEESFRQTHLNTGLNAIVLRMNDEEYKQFLASQAENQARGPHSLETENGQLQGGTMASPLGTIYDSSSSWSSTSSSSDFSIELETPPTLVENSPRNTQSTICTLPARGDFERKVRRDSVAMYREKYANNLITPAADFIQGGRVALVPELEDQLYYQLLLQKACIRADRAFARPDRKMERSNLVKELREATRPLYWTRRGTVYRRWVSSIRVTGFVDKLELLQTRKRAVKVLRDSSFITVSSPKHCEHKPAKIRGSKGKNRKRATYITNDNDSGRKRSKLENGQWIVRETRFARRNRNLDLDDQRLPQFNFTKWECPFLPGKKDAMVLDEPAVFGKPSYASFGLDGLSSWGQTASYTPAPASGGNLNMFGSFGDTNSPMGAINTDIFGNWGNNAWGNSTLPTGSDGDSMQGVETVGGTPQDQPPAGGLFGRWGNNNTNQNTTNQFNATNPFGNPFSTTSLRPPHQQNGGGSIFSNFQSNLFKASENNNTQNQVNTTGLLGNLLQQNGGGGIFSNFQSNLFKSPENNNTRISLAGTQPQLNTGGGIFGQLPSDSIFSRAAATNNQGCMTTTGFGNNTTFDPSYRVGNAAQSSNNNSCSEDGDVEMDVTGGGTGTQSTAGIFSSVSTGGLGLFGVGNNTNQQQTMRIFSSAPAGGLGVFDSYNSTTPPNAPASGSGVFGSNNTMQPQQQTTSIFSNATRLSAFSSGNTQPQQQTTGIFSNTMGASGNNTATLPAAGLGPFGNGNIAMQPQTTSIFSSGPAGGLGVFGNNNTTMQPQQQTTSIFASAPTGGLGVFGGGNATWPLQPPQQQTASIFANAKGLGVFGNNGITTTLPAAGLDVFGNNNATTQLQQQTASIFASAPTGGLGIFDDGNTISQPQQPQQQTAGIFANTKGLGVFGNNNTTPQPQQQTTSIFSSAPTGGLGIFGGGNANTQPQQQTAGIFQNVTRNVGVFGNNMGSATNQTSGEASWSMDIDMNTEEGAASTDRSKSTLATGGGGLFTNIFSPPRNQNQQQVPPSTPPRSIFTPIPTNPPPLSRKVSTLSKETSSTEFFVNLNNTHSHGHNLEPPSSTDSGPTVLFGSIQGREIIPKSQLEPKKPKKRLGMNQLVTMARPVTTTSSTTAALAVTATVITPAILSTQQARNKFDLEFYAPSQASKTTQKRREVEGQGASNVNLIGSLGTMLAGGGQGMITEGDIEKAVKNVRGAGGRQTGARGRVRWGAGRVRGCEFGDFRNGLVVVD